MPKECGSWRAFRAQARRPPPGPAHPLHYQLTQSLPPGRLLSPRPHSCCVELARQAHTDTGLNRPVGQSPAALRHIFNNKLPAYICPERERVCCTAAALRLSLLDSPPARLAVIQSSEPPHNFLPTLKLSLCHFRAKSFKIMEAGQWRGRDAAKWLTDELPFPGRSSLKPRCVIPTSAQASLYDLWSLGPSTANPT
ncbi:hypothetical protein Q8A73_007537 [Channa argus]|nr:hypothetical protein Q8A73_007537 [Channa argus]